MSAIEVNKINAVINSLNSLDIDNNQDVQDFKNALNRLSLENMKDQHPNNARIILLKSLDETPIPKRDDFEWNRDFFIRSISYLKK